MSAIRAALASFLAMCIVSHASAVSPNMVRKPVLTKDELRACMDREAELEERRDSLRAARAEHSATLAKLSAEAIALSKVLRELDKSDKAAIENYNRRNEARNRLVDINNQRADALNAAAAEQQTAEADYVADCVSRPFLKSDEDALRKERVKNKKPRGQDGQLVIPPPPPTPPAPSSIRDGTVRT